MSPYIRDGHILRGEDEIRCRRNLFSWQRFLFLVAVGGALIVTNPPNQEWLSLLAGPSFFPSYTTTLTDLKSHSYSSWMTYLEDWLFGQTIGMTNYLFFSTQNSSVNSLVFVIGGQYFPCRYDDPDFGSICATLESVMCHGQPVLWDPHDLPYTAHRILCWGLILSAAIAFCFPYDPAPSQRILDIPIMYSLFLSVFSGDHLIFDIIHCNTVVYPTLAQLYNILPNQREDFLWTWTGDLESYFWLWVAVLVMGIGGGSHHLASLLWGNSKGVYLFGGFTSVVAAFMGYGQRMDVFGNLLERISPGLGWITMRELYWTELAILIVQGRGHQATAWIIAGVLGTFTARYHLGNVVIFGNLYKFLGIA